MAQIILKRIKIPLLDGRYHVLEVKEIFLVKIIPIPKGMFNEIDLQISLIEPFKVNVNTIEARRFRGDYELYRLFENACNENTRKLLDSSSKLSFLEKYSMYETHS